MGWTYLPVSPGETVDARQMGDLRAAIIERRGATGLGATDGSGDPPQVASGNLCEAATINAYRQRVEELIPRYVNTDGSGERWTKPGILQAALGAGTTEWTTVPARAGGPTSAGTLETGDVMYAEHVNEMRQVINLLYLVPLEEKEGRQFATNGVGGWAWSEGDPDPVYTATAVGNHQTGGWNEHAESAPFDFHREPIGDVTVLEVKAKGALYGSGSSNTVKFINFVNGDLDDPQPTDRSWKMQIRISEARPADSARGDDTTVACENNLADDGSHSEDSKNDSGNLLEVYVIDHWHSGVFPDVPEPDGWPFWLTFVIEDFTDVINAYTAEAQATERELQIWWAKAQFNLEYAWAKLDFEYK
jgi:hypothetical protein